MLVVGIDEVGRGCWAGPVVAGAVVLPAVMPVPDKTMRLIDSTKMTAKQRTQTAGFVREHALAYGLGWVQPAEVDVLGLTESVRLAMERAKYGFSGAVSHVARATRRSSVESIGNAAASSGRGGCGLPVRG